MIAVTVEKTRLPRHVMKDEEKTRDQLLEEVTALRDKISDLESAGHTREKVEELLKGQEDSFVQIDDGPPQEADSLESTQSIHLDSFFTAEVTSTGSFSFSGVDQTWFGKLLQALPNPALLVDDAYEIIFVNIACHRISPNFKSALGKRFDSLFPNSWVADEVRELLEKVFLTRKRGSTQAIVQIGDGRIWGRIYLRSIRLGKSRSILALVEDLTLEKEALILKQQHEQEILKERDDLEARVTERTSELLTANTNLRKEIDEREKGNRHGIGRL